MSASIPFVVSIEPYEPRYYRDFKTAARGVIGYASYPHEVHLYVGEGVAVDWLAFEEWKNKYGSRNVSAAFTRPAPLAPPYDPRTGRMDPVAEAQYRAELKDFLADQKAFEKNLYKVAAQELEAVFI